MIEGSRHALEIRHESFRTKEFIALLRAYNVALVCADAVDWPRLMDVTADFAYCRLHGSKVAYASGSGLKEIDAWARRVLAWGKGREPADAERVVDQPAPKRERCDVFLYFDNDAKVRAPVDAKKLVARLSRSLKNREMPFSVFLVVSSNLLVLSCSSPGNRVRCSTK
jgi:uncharacterized protein YecE (DUF72 family)